MILEFSCANHKSIMDKVTFSMIASKDNMFEESLESYSNSRVLNSAVIYGANGSGKSNLLDALAKMQFLVASSINNQPGDNILQTPHKLSSYDKPSNYDIQFVKDDIRYTYGFSIKNNIIDEEYLYYFPNKKKVKIFERKGTDIEPGNKYKDVFNVVKRDILKENRLVLSCSANYTNLDEIKNVFLFFVKDIVFYNSGANNWIQYSIESMIKDEKTKEKFLEIIKAFDTDIKNVRMRIEQVQIKDIIQKTNLPDELKKIFPTGNANSIDAKVIYDNFETDLLREESMGIKKLFEIICPIIDILENGKILICDELESSLHESVVYEIIKMFNKKGNGKFAQLIFTTHDTNLLDANLFRRDQIWFTELHKEKRNTELYSLIELKNVRKTENLERGYISGKYGGIPMLNRNFFKSFEISE